MRVLQNKIEYVSSCLCGLKFVYPLLEVGRQFNCPKCNNDLKTNTKQPITWIPFTMNEGKPVKLLESTNR